MFLLYALAAGLILGLLSGGRPAGLAALRLAWGPLMVAGLLAQVILFSDPVAAAVGRAGPLLYVATTALVVAAVARNLRVTGMPLVTLGALSNLVAIIANGGYMPASPSALAALGKSVPVVYSNSSVVAQPAVSWLTDIFALPAWLPAANIFSVGDVLIAVGVAVTVIAAMHAPASRGVPAAAR
jgi:Family of unknown function (DUF5317)